MNEIINKLKDVKNSLAKKKTIDYNKAKKSVETILRFLFKTNLIDRQELLMLIDKLENKKLSENFTLNNKQAGVGKNILIVILIAIIDIILYKSFFVNNNNAETKPIEQQKQQQKVQQVKEIPQPFVPTKRKLPKHVSESIVLDQAFKLIVQFESKQLGNVYDNNGRIIAKNVHVVYDDKIPVGGRGKKWNGKPSTLDKFIKNCIGKPTIGYGTTNKTAIQTGYISQQQAVKYCKDYILFVAKIVKKRLGQQYWDTLNRNQKAATLSYFYNCGPYAKADKQFQAIRRQDWKQAARQMDIVTSNGQIQQGLVERRKIQQRLFLTPVK